MTAYLVKGWCRVCDAKTVQNRIALKDPRQPQLVEVTVCAECGEQVL